MRALTFASRNTKEIVRDPLTLIFGLGFPLVLILLLSAIQRSIPVALFEIEHLAPGITVFGLSFISLFSATIISKDRSTSFAERLYTTPMTSFDFILGYTLPFIAISVLQGIISYLAAIALGLEVSVNIIFSVISIAPVSILFIAIGLLAGSVLNDKAVGGVCGALLTNLSAWLSGIWFDLELVGGVFRKVAHALPFYHAVELERGILRGDFNSLLPHIYYVLGYAFIIFALAVFLYLKQMKKR